MNISKFFFILLSCLFSCAALPAKAAIATQNTHQTHQLTLKKEKKGAFSTLRSKKPSANYDVNKYGYTALLYLALAGICAYYVLTASGPGAIWAYAFLGILGAGFLLVAVIHFLIFSRKRYKLKKANQ
jgi:hypothetical protein